MNQYDEHGRRMKAYPGTNAAITRRNSDLLERFALQIIGDVAAMAAPSIAFGGLVQI